MSATIDEINRQVILEGGIGDAQGGRYEFVSPEAGCIGMRVAVRLYFDSFDGNEVSPWTRQTSGTWPDDAAYRYDTNDAWDYSFCLGFGFTDEFPATDLAQTDDMGLIKGFVGVRSGGGSSGASDVLHMHYRGTTGIGSVAGSFGIKTATNIHNNRTVVRFWGDPTKQSSSFYGHRVTDLDPSISSSSASFWLYSFPKNPAEGAKFTLGLELRRSTVDEATNFRCCVNTDSLPEADLLDVFDSNDAATSLTKCSLSAASVESDDAFREGGADFVAPGYFLFRWGGPSQKLICAGLRYQYLYP